MKILLASIPATGHFNPILVAARILKEAGHETAIYTSVVFRDKIERAEVRFFPLPEDADQGVRDFIASFLEKHKVTPGPEELVKAYTGVFIDPMISQFRGVLKTCGELGIGFVPWGPVGQGYLTVTIDAQTKFDPQKDTRSEFPRFSSENIAANMPIADFLKQFSEKKNATPVQVSLAWLLAQEPFIVPIPGTRSIDHLQENLRAVDVRLTPADLREIETALSKIKVHGGRMNEERMMAVDQTV